MIDLYDYKSFEKPVLEAMIAPRFKKMLKSMSDHELGMEILIIAEKIASLEKSLTEFMEVNENGENDTFLEQELELEYELEKTEEYLESLVACQKLRGMK